MKYLIQNKHWIITQEYDLDKILYLLIDRPGYVSHGCYWTCRNGIALRHRDYDLPADYCNYTNKLRWIKNGKRHRENNKPAIIHHDGLKVYYINDKHIRIK